MHTNDQQADRLIEDMANDPRLLQLKAFTQHGKVSTYDHSVSVAKMSLKLARMLRLRVDSEQLVRGALLHDYYLYPEKWAVEMGLIMLGIDALVFVGYLIVQRRKMG